MIVTVTLNPGPDRTLTVPALKYDRVLRATSLSLDWGGKGLNVSRALKALGTESVATGFAGGYAGQMVSDGMAALGIATDFVPIAGETRTNTAFIEEGTHRYIKVNETGPTIQPAELAQFFEMAARRVSRGDIWVIGGRPPLGVPASAYPQLIDLLQGAGARVLLDTSGDCLRLGSEAGPFLVKPNLSEATEMVAGSPPPHCAADQENAFGRQAQDPAKSIAVDDHIRFFLERGVSLVALSMGADGLVLASGEQTIWAKPPQVRVRNPVGAGDALMAALAWALDREMTMEEMARWGVAAGTASATRSRVGFDDLLEVEALLPRVVVD